jgi:hypothetical protein
MNLIKTLLVSLPLYFLSSSLSSSSTTIEEYHFPIENTNHVDHEKFLMALGNMESGNRYKVVNKWGYMGRYQFGKATLKGLGIEVSRKDFISNPELQEEAMQKLLQHNKEKLQTYITLYEGRKVNGILITESGVLAAAHLAGFPNVKRFFKYGNDFKDGNGTKMTSYMKKFGGYKLNI